MFKLNGIKLGAAILLLSSSVSASVIIDNQQIPTEDIVSINITPGTGTLVINTTVGYEVTPSGGNTTPPPDSAKISSFTASPTSFVEGGSTTLSWNTQNATSCTPTNGTASWQAKSINVPSGSTSVQIGTPGSYVFTLVCTGSDNVSVTRNLTINVAEESTPNNTSCNSPLTGSVTTWNSFWGVAFPNPGYANKEDSVPNRGYKAYKFNTGNIVDDGLMVTVGVTHTSGSRLGSISACPGDFQVSNACKHKWGIGGGITWATNGKSGACQLQPNTDYYFNVTFVGDGVSPETATCTGACGVKLQHVNR